MAVGFGDAQDVLDPADQHRVALVEVELQVAEQDDVARVVGGEHAVEELEGVQRIGAGGDAAFLGIDQALGGGPGVEVAFEGGAGGGDFRFGAGFFGTDDGEAGIAGAEVGGELVLHGMMDLMSWLGWIGDRVEVGQGDGGSLGVRVGRAEVGAFPGEAGLAGGIAVEELAGGGAADLPLLGAFAEADVRGPEDGESPERTEIDRFGVEAVDVTAGVEAKGLAHGLCASFAELLLVLVALGLPPEVGFAGALPGFAEGVLDGLGRGFAAFALEAIGLDGDFPEWGNADMDAAAHSEPPSRVSRIEPSASTWRVVRSPRERASRMVLWTP